MVRVEGVGVEVFSEGGKVLSYYHWIGILDIESGEIRSAMFRKTKCLTDL